MTTLLSDTIVAIATPLGVGGVGVIRVSGDEVKSILRAVFPKCILKIEPRYVMHGTIIDPVSQFSIDDACVIYFVVISVSYVA